MLAERWVTTVFLVEHGLTSYEREVLNEVLLLDIFTGVSHDINSMPAFGDIASDLDIFPIGDG